jgi:ABC-type lipoprotein release transport system permease subunit
MVLVDGARLAAVGLFLGLLVSLLVMRYLRSLLYEVQPGDPVTLAAVCVLISVVALAASYGPASRATAVDPAAVLRDE